MKTPYLIFIATVLTIASCSSGNSIGGYVEIPKDKIETQRSEIAYKIADDLLRKFQEGKFQELSEEIATDEIRHAYSVEVQKKTYTKIEEIFGNYKSMQLEQQWRSEKEPIYDIFRFRGLFDAYKGTCEVRVVLDKDNKLAGFFIKYWKDKLN